MFIFIIILIIVLAILLQSGILSGMQIFDWGSSTCKVIQPGKNSCASMKNRTVSLQHQVNSVGIPSNMYSSPMSSPPTSPPSSPMQKNGKSGLSVKFFPKTEVAMYDRDTGKILARLENTVI